MAAGGIRTEAELSPRSAEAGRDLPHPSPPVSEVLSLEQVSSNSFRSFTTCGQDRPYGGAVAAQAFLAAARTVPPDRRAHHLSAQFLRAGDRSRPTDFTVATDRDGTSFSARRVTAHQQGSLLLTLAVSFQVEEHGIEHQLPAPDLTVEGEPRRSLTADETRENWLSGVMERLGVTMRFPVAGGRGPDGRAAGERFLVRMRETLGDEPMVHAAGMVYLSDLLMVSAALAPHGLPAIDPGMQFATVNHSVWLHAPARADDWLLYDLVGAWTGGARGLSHGRLYDSTGRLCASTAQEALLRLHAGGHRAHIPDTTMKERT